MPASALGNLSGITTADSMNIENSASLLYGLTIQSTSSIASSASLTATSLTLTSAQTAGDLLSTGLLANANTGIDLNGASLTTTAGALTLNAQSSLNVNTTGVGMSAVKGALITSFSNADIDITGSSQLKATGGDLDITASVNGSLTASAGDATVKLVVIAGQAAPSVTIEGGSQVSSTSGAVDAQATTNLTITSSTSPITNSGSASVDAAVLSTTFSDGASMTVDGGADVSAKTTDTLAASSTLNSTTTADASVPKTAGAAVAVSVITGDTSASVADATVSGSAVSVTAASSRTLTTIAKSSPGGSAASGDSSNDSEQTLGTNDASTGSGSVTIAGAIAVSTDTGTTTAFLGNKASIIAGSAGAVTVSAGSADVVAVTADGEFTQAGTTGVGIGVAVGVADRSDSAYITGTVAVTAGTLDVAVLAPSPSSFSASATSGVGNSSKVGVAGSLAINVTILDHEAYLDNAAVLTLTGSTNTTFKSHDNVANSAVALPSDTGGTSAGVGIGAAFAIDYGQDANNATIDDGAALAGANNLTLTAMGSHTMLTNATAGGAGETGITPVVAVSIANDDSSAELGTGSVLTIGGALLASSTLTNAVSTNTAGDTKSGKTGVGISIAVAVIKDNSTATTARNISAGTGISFGSTLTSASESSAAASVVGGPQDDGSGDQSANSDIASEANEGTGTGSAQDKKATGTDKSADKGTESTSAPSAATASSSGSSSSSPVSVAGAIAVDVNLGTSKAFIPSGLTITAGGTLAVKSAADVDGYASATGSAVTNSTQFDPSAVSTTANTINLGTSTTLKTGDGVVYYAGPGGGITGLTSGTTYYVNVVSGGTIKLYDSAADAQSGGSTGLEKLTSTGSTGQFLQNAGGDGTTGTSVGAAIGITYASDTNLLIWAVRPSRPGDWILELLGLLPFVNLIFGLVLLFKPGTDGRNTYGGKTPPNGVGVIILASLMPAFMVLGIVAAIALPAYTGYVKRAQQAQFQAPR